MKHEENCMCDVCIDMRTRRKVAEREAQPPPITPYEIRRGERIPEPRKSKG